MSWSIVHVFGVVAVVLYWVRLGRVLVRVQCEMRELLQVELSWKV